MRTGNYMEIGRMDELSRLGTFIHRLDARATTLTAAAFVLVVMSFPRYEISALLPLFLFPIALMAIGNLPVAFLLRKLLIAAPFALLVGLFNPFLDRQVMFSLHGIPITGGWLSFLSILIRFLLTGSAALILVACTGIYRLCSGLERMGLPRAFAVQILFLYRYLFVIADEGFRMKRSVELRSAGSGSLRLPVYASLIGHLLLRSMDRAQRIYQAMVARGFDGEIRVLHSGSWSWREWIFCAGWVVFFSISRMWNLSVWVGGWL